MKRLASLFLVFFALGAHAAQPKQATFAGGCFWCVEEAFEGHAGVKDVVSGFMGGHKANPTYEQVSEGTTGHLEVVQVTYDPDQISYPTLLNIFWRNIDPTDAGGQFVKAYLGTPINLDGRKQCYQAFRLHLREKGFSLKKSAPQSVQTRHHPSVESRKLSAPKN